MTGITWLKHHHGAALDAKWLAVADMAGSTPANVWSIFSGALEYASEQAERGSIAGLNPQILASFYRIAVDEVRHVLTALKQIGVLVGDRITNWAKRQGTSLGSPARPVSAGALRTRRWRRNKTADARQGSLDLGQPAAVVTMTQGVTRGVTDPVTSAAERDRDREIPHPPNPPLAEGGPGDLINHQRQERGTGNAAAVEQPVAVPRHQITLLMPIAGGADDRAAGGRQHRETARQRRRREYDEAVAAIVLAGRMDRERQAASASG
jgi:hypothetical protein